MVRSERGPKLEMTPTKSKAGWGHEKIALSIISASATGQVSKSCYSFRGANCRRDVIKSLDRTSLDVTP
jgi:hypothetical protein